MKTVDKWIDIGILSGAMLTEHKLVDKQLHLDQIEKYLRSQFGGKARIRTAAKVLKAHRDTWGKRKKIAVLYAVGSLIDGKTPTGFFSSGEPLVRHHSSIQSVLSLATEMWLVSSFG